MGKRLSIEVLNLLEAGCMIKQRIEHYPADNQFPAMDMRYLDVTFPQDAGLKESFAFDFNVHGNHLTVETDYNGWGQNYQTLSPVLRKLDITHSIF